MKDIPHNHRDAISSYHLLQFIGPGPISRVYMGEHKAHSQQKIAVKIIEAAPLQSTDKQQQALQEIRMLARLNNHSILPILEVGIEKDILYLVYPYVETGSLQQRLAATPNNLLPLKETLAILKQVGEALHFAHQQQIVHANLKPENVLLLPGGDALLMDFRLHTLTQSARTARTIAIFAASYMAPEQFRGQATPLSDQYALACLAYTLLTGRPPFEADDVKILAQKHANERPASPALLQRERAQHIESVLLKALSKQPEERYPDVAAFLDTLLAPPPLDALIETMILPHVRVNEPTPTNPQELSAPVPSDQSLSREVPIPFILPPLAGEQLPVVLPSIANDQHWGEELSSAPTIAQGISLPADSQTPTELTGRTSVRSQKSKRRALLAIACISLLICLSLIGTLVFANLSSANHQQAGQKTLASNQSTSSVSTQGTQTSVTSSTPIPTSTTRSTNLTPGPTPTRPVPTTPPSSSPTAVSSPTATPPPLVSNACQVSYTIPSQWAGGFIANLTIRNTGSATFSNWNLVFTFSGNQQITSSWNSIASQNSHSVTLANAGFNATLSPGISATPGFQATWSGSNTPPTSFTLNDVTCSLAS